MSKIPIQIDLLYFDDCPSYKTVWNNLIEIISQHHLEVVVRPIFVDTSEKAEQLAFAGSPSIQIDGVDLEHYQGNGVMACRVYEENGNQGFPSRERLEKRLLEVAQL